MLAFVTPGTANQSANSEKRRITQPSVMPEAKAVPWQHSDAKKALTDGILDGTVSGNLSWRQVFAMREELYTPYKKNFATNLRNLRKSLQSLQDRADEDQEAVLHDLAAFPRSTVNARGHSRFDGSEAQRFLKKCIDDGDDEGLFPKDIWLTRLEYQEFPLKVFRDHVSQERRRRCEKSYWLNKNKKN